MVEPLRKNGKIQRKGPVMLVIMDGVGFGKYKDGDAVDAAMTKNLDSLYATSPWTKLKAHGTAVGLPSDADMGNSEVGHNAMGCGRVFAQGAKLVSNAISWLTLNILLPISDAGTDTCAVKAGICFLSGS